MDDQFRSKIQGKSYLEEAWKAGTLKYIHGDWRRMNQKEEPKVALKMHVHQNENTG